MRNILIIILFTTGIILTSCSKDDDPQPITNCEEGGEEVTVQP